MVGYGSFELREMLGILIERNHIHLCRNTADQLPHPARVVEGIVETRNRHILEGHAPAPLERKEPELGHQVTRGGVEIHQGLVVLGLGLLAALVARGTTEVRRVYHIDRGYERMERKLVDLGGAVRREDEPLVT